MTTNGGPSLSDDLPRSTETLIIGGGLVGLFCGLNLLRSGHEVLIIDKGTPGNGASGHNAGILSVGNVVPTGTPGVIRSVPKMLADPLAPLAIRWRYLPQMLPWLTRFVLSSRPATVERSSVAIATLIERSIPAYREFLPEGDDEGVFTGGGHLITYLSDASFDKAHFGRELRRRRGVNLEILDDAEMTAMDPSLAGRFRRAMWFPDGFNTDPNKLMEAVLQRYVGAGGRIAQAEVTGFEDDGARVTSVLTSHGAVGSDAVVLTAGAWSRKLSARLGARVPLDTERGYGVEIPDPGVPLKTAFISADFHLAFNPLGDRLLLAGTDELAGIEAPPNFERANKLIRAAGEIFPGLNTEGATSWMNFRPSLPDARPVIDRSQRYANAYLSFGHGHIGVTLAAISGKLIGELVEGHPPSVDLDPFRADRFRAWFMPKRPRKTARRM